MGQGTRWRPEDLRAPRQHRGPALGTQEMRPPATGFLQRGRRLLGRAAFPPSGFCSNNRRGDGLRTRASCIFMNPTFAQTTAPACFSVFRQNGRLSSSGLSKARADWLGLRRQRCSGWHGVRGRPRSGVCTAHLPAGGSCSDVSSEAAVGPVVDTVLLGCDLPALQRPGSFGNILDLCRFFLFLAGAPCYRFNAFLSF